MVAGAASRAAAACFVASLAVAFLTVSAGPGWGLEKTSQDLPKAAQLPPSEETAPASLTPVERSDEDLLVLEMRLRDFVLSDGLTGYRWEGGVLLPLGSVMQALDFAIAVRPGEGRAEGWFLQEDRRFSLDLARAAVTVEGKPALFDPRRVELHLDDMLDDIYVDTTLLEAWFPVDLEVDSVAARIKVVAREPLPIEQRLERERLQAQLGARQRRHGPRYPALDVPYKGIDWPFIDVSVDLSGRRRANGEQINSVHQTVFLTGDLMFMNGELFLTGDNRDTISDARFRLGRKDPDGALLGPLAATEFAGGDVVTPELTLAARAHYGRGFAISSFPLTRPAEFDRTNFRGDLSAGWQVELYRNDVLLDFVAESRDDRYEFVDVPLLFGRNEIRLVFHGPQGQRREEMRSLFVGDDMVPPGEQYYRLSLIQHEDSLVPASRVQFDDARRGKLRVVAEYERGISQGVSIAASLSSLPIEQRDRVVVEQEREVERRTFLGLGLRASMGNLFTTFDVMGSDTGGAGRIAAQGRLGPVSLFGAHERYEDFVGERNERGSDVVRSRSELRFDSVVPLSEARSIPVSLKAKRERRGSGVTNIDIGNHVSLVWAPLLVTNILDFRIVSGTGGTTMFDGSLLVNSFHEPWTLRGKLDYRLRPEKSLEDVAFTAERTFGSGYRARFTVDRSLFSDQLTTYTAGLSRRFDSFAVGVNTSFSDDGSFFGGLALSFSIGPEPRSGRWSLREPGAAKQAAVSARAFFDRNGNGGFDPEDDPLPDVAFKINRHTSDVTTDERGVALITGLPVHQPVDLAVARGTLEDPFWKPTRDGVSLVARPGQPAIVDFPVVATGEIDGTVFRRRGDTERRVPNLRVELLDAEGRVAHETRTEFDGFYLFEDVPPGRYVVRIAAAEAAGLDVAVPAGKQVEITADGNVESGIDFIMEPLRE